MTNIQAINLLKGLWQSLDDYCELNDEGKAAFCMAIEALSCSEFPNSSDCISRQAAIDFIDTGRLCNPNEPRWSDNEIVNFLKSRPSADRPKGMWVFDTQIPIGKGAYSAGYRCSICKKDYFRVEEMNFCPNCGADMRGEQDANND